MDITVAALPPHNFRCAREMDDLRESLLLLSSYRRQSIGFHVPGETEREIWGEQRARHGPDGSLS